MYLTIPFTAGETKTINAGKFFKVKSATYDVECIFFTHSGQEKYKTEFSQGDAINDPDGFSHVTVTSANAQTVIIHVLPVVMLSSNLVGDVNCLISNNYETNESLNGLACSATKLITGSTSGVMVTREYRAICLYNPPGNTLNYLVDSIGFENQIEMVDLQNATKGFIQVPSYLIDDMLNNAMMQTYNTWSDQSGLGDAGYKDDFSIESDAQFWGQRTSGSAPSEDLPYGHKVRTDYIKAIDANGNGDFNRAAHYFKNPVIVRPGSAYMVSIHTPLLLNTANNMRVNLEWREVAI